MKRAVSIFGFVTLAALATACGQEGAKEGVLTVHGTASQKLTLDNTRAVAVGTDGRTFWAYLDQERDFTLRLPVGQSYRVLLANQLDGGGQKSLGYVTFPSEEGRSEWLGANEPGTVDLGRIGAATTTRTTEGSVGLKCSGCDQDDDEAEEDDDRSSHDDDHECREKGKRKKAEKPKSNSCDGCDDDDDHAGGGKGESDDDECDVCRDDDAPEKELRPSKQPDAEKCKDKDKDKHQGKKDGYDDRKPCPKKSGGKSDASKGDAGGDDGDDGDDDHDGKSGGDSPSWPSGGESSEGSSGGNASSGGSSGGKPKGSSCQVTSHCSTECACVASRCEEH